MTVQHADQGGYDLITCTCPGGPHLGARKLGAPCVCETCGFITRESLDSILAPVWDAAYDRGVHDETMANACAMRGGPVSDCDCQVRTTNPYESLS